MKRIFLLNHFRLSLDRLSATVPRIRCSRVYGTKPNLPSIAPVNYVQHKLDRPQHTTESDIDWDSEMQKIYEEEENHSLLDVVSDESAIDVEPRLGPSFNLAAYASKSPTLQELVKLGVNLYKIEKRKGLAKYLVGLEFERDMKEHIYFMNKVVGIDASLLGMFLTKNPLIFRASIDDLQTRINYLESKNFKPAEITDIVTRNPFWLSFSTRRIDARLGYFQRKFHLSGKDVRKLTLLLPKLITYNMEAIAEMTFTVREELELSKIQTKKLLLKCPHIWITRRLDLMERYDILTRELKIPQEIILTSPSILQARSFVIRERHGFLKSLGRAQYDRKLDLYVSLEALATGTNEEFAVNVAKSTYEDFDRYLRTL